MTSVIFDGNENDWEKLQKLKLTKAIRILYLVRA